MKTVECRPAFEWTCDDCGTDNFGRLVRAEMSTDEELELRQNHNEYGEGEFVLLPEEVCCQHCGYWSKTSDG